MDAEAIMASAIAVPFPAFNDNPPTERAEKLSRILANLDSAREAVRTNIINLTPNVKIPDDLHTTKDTEMPDAPPAAQAHPAINTATTNTTSGQTPDNAEEGEINEPTTVAANRNRNQDQDQDQDNRLPDDAIIASISTPRDPARAPTSYARKPRPPASPTNADVSQDVALPISAKANANAARHGTRAGAATNPSLTDAISPAAPNGADPNAPLRQQLLAEYDAHMATTRAFYMDALRRTRGITEEVVAAAERGAVRGVVRGAGGRGGDGKAEHGRERRGQGQIGGDAKGNERATRVEDLERVVSPVAPVTPVTPTVSGGTYDASRDPRRRRR